MKHKENVINQILDSYLDGTINAEQVRELHEKLERDEDVYITEELISEVHLPEEIYQAATSPFQQLPDKTLEIPYRNKNKTTREEYDIKSHTFAQKLLVIISLLAIISFALAITLLLSKPPLFEQYYSAHPMQKEELNRIVIYPDVWQKAVEMYQAEEYAAATKQFDKLIELNPSRTDIDFFYKGVALLEQGKEQQATLAFEKVQGQASDKLKDEANWYLGLIALKEGKVVQARKLLEEVAANSAHYYSKEAEKLMEVLR